MSKKRYRFKKIKKREIDFLKKEKEERKKKDRDFFSLFWGLFFVVVSKKFEQTLFFSGRWWKITQRE